MSMIRSALRAVDFPPAWLLLFIAVAWIQSRYAPGVRLGGWAAWPGAVLIGAGLLITGVAAAQFFAHRTTIVPRRTPSALVQGGIYRISRNPIYLADTLILAGLVLRWGSLPGLLLVPLFMLLIRTRYILGEEAGLRREFGAAFEAYSAKTRRWL